MNTNTLFDNTSTSTIQCSIDDLTNDRFESLNEYSTWTALVTPFDLQGNIDFTSLKTIAIDQADAGNALLLLGSTGEGLALSAEQQLNIVQFICQLKLTVPLMVAVGGYDLAAQVAWIERCNQLPIHAYLLATPLYAKPGPVGQSQWFTRLLDASEFPCMLYNVPSRSGVSIPLSTVINVQDHDNCWAMKEASGNLNDFLAYREHCTNIDLYSGEDALIPYLAKAGAKGLVSVCSNAWPKATNHYVKLSLLGQVQGLFPLWKNAIETLFQVANPIPVKALMFVQKNITSPVLRAPLTHLELTENSNLLAADKQINHWFSLQK